MNRIALVAALLTATPALAEPVAFEVDPSHSQTVFHYTHLGFSTTYGMFSGWEGTILFDREEPANSSVEVSIPASAMFTGWEARDANLAGADFLGFADGDTVTFISTGIEVTGEGTADITGDLSLGGVTRSVVLDARFNAEGPHPQENRNWVGFDATTTLLRSDFEAGAFAPFISDEVVVMISIEAGQVSADN